MRKGEIMRMNQTVRAVLEAREEVINAWFDEGRDLLSVNDYDSFVEAVSRLVLKKMASGVASSEKSG